jgi:aminobenzoyl-glutamate utilization protein B
MIPNTQEIWPFVDKHKEEAIRLSDRVWDTPETVFDEFASVAEHTAELKRQGFRVFENYTGIPTAVMAEAGEGGPVIAILGEYDALPGLSQEANIAEQRPLAAGTPGHGCGHNLLGAGALLAAAAVKDYLAANGMQGRVRYYGCPAEEGGAAKGFMVRDGAFDDVDIAISWHPAAFNGVTEPASLANTFIDFEFFGRTSHASAAPHIGRSALDAAELMNVGVNYMREHMPQDARIHYAYLDVGGTAPNVVQGKAKLRYVVRARDLNEMWPLLARVRKIAEGAALMTETKVTERVISAMSNLMGNTPLELAMQETLERLGPPPFDDADYDFARQIQSSLGPDDVTAACRRFGATESPGVPLHSAILPYGRAGERLMGSTDVGDVSWVVPTVQARVASQAIGTPGHSWQVTAQGKSPLAHKGMVTAAKAMAGVAVDAILNPALIVQAKADLAKRTAGGGYVCPIPKDVQPDFKPRRPDTPLPVPQDA